MRVVQPDILQKENVYQLYLFCNEKEQQTYERNNRWYPYTVDINDKSINKSVGIERVLLHFGIHRKKRSHSVII